MKRSTCGRLFTGVACLAAACGPAGAESPDLAKAEVAVVQVISISASGKATGTGVLLPPGQLIATNFHVVSGATELRARLASDMDTVVELRPVAVWPDLDLAVLEPKSGSPKFIELGMQPMPWPADPPQVGADVTAIGFPLGLGFTVNRGILSGIRRYGDLPYAYQRGEPVRQNSKWLQTDCPINPGNSGGPLLDGTGALIGINTFASRSANDVYFALSVDEIRAATNDGLIRRPPGMTNEGLLGKTKIVSKAGPREPEATTFESPQISALKEKLDWWRDSTHTHYFGITATPVRVLISTGLPSSMYEFFEDVPRSEVSDSTRLLLAQARSIGPKDTLREIRSRVMVTSVVQDSPLLAQGVQPGDLIEYIGKTRVRTGDEIQDAEIDSGDLSGPIGVRIRKLAVAKRPISADTRRRAESVNRVVIAKKLTNCVIQRLTPLERAKYTTPLSLELARRERSGPLFIVTATLADGRDPSIDREAKPLLLIAVQNQSDDVIDGIEFDMACYDRFGEPVSWAGENRFVAISQDPIAPGEAKLLSYRLYLRDMTSRVDLAVIRVHLDRGGIWWCRNAPTTTAER